MAAPDTAARLQMISMARPPSMYTVCFRSSRLIRYRCACRSTRKRMSTTFCSRSRSRRPACRSSGRAPSRGFALTRSVGHPSTLPRRCLRSRVGSCTPWPSRPRSQHSTARAAARCRSGSAATTPRLHSKAPPPWAASKRARRHRGCQANKGRSVAPIPLPHPSPTTTLPPSSSSSPAHTRALVACKRISAPLPRSGLRSEAVVSKFAALPPRPAIATRRGAARPDRTPHPSPCPHPAADPSARLNVRSPRAARSQGVLLRARAQRSLVAAGRRQWPGAYAAGAWVVQQDGRLASGPAGRAARQPALRHRLLRAAAWPAVRCRAPAATGRPLSPLSPSPLPPHSHPS